MITNKINLNIQGFVKIVDLTSNKILFEGENAINSETMSMIVANMLEGNNSCYVYEMHFGNGGIIDSSTLKDVEENLLLGSVAELYNSLTYKIVDANDLINNVDPSRNYVTIAHSDGLNYTDLIVVCTLEEEDPNNSDGEIIFNELGLKSKGLNGENTGYLLSHIVFENIPKTSANVIQITYTLRISL